MKVTTTRVVPEFAPVEVRFVLESQAEVDALYVLGNFGQYVAYKLTEDTTTQVPREDIIKVLDYLHDSMVDRVGVVNH